MSLVASSRPMTLRATLLQRRSLIAFSLLMTYGAGFWLWLLHNLEGAVEPNEPPGVIHWLRDSSLSLPLVVLGVFIGAQLARRLLQRNGRGASDLLVGALVAAVLAMYASVVLSVGNPVHGWLFGGTVHGGGHDLPFAVHMLRDGLLALTANELLAFLLVAGVLCSRWMTLSRRSRVASATSL